MRAVQFGAGGVGRGFIGHLLHVSGCGIRFVDVNQPVIDLLNNRGEYRVRLAKEGFPSHTVDGAAAYSMDQLDEICEELTAVELVFTAVGANALPHVAPVLAKGIEARLVSGVEDPLNVFVCENLAHGAELFRDMVWAALPEKLRDQGESLVGFSGVVVGRMIPVLPASWREEDPLQVLAEDYWVLPVDGKGILGPRPAIKGMVFCDDFPAEEARKLYLHNMVHAVLAYKGYEKGHTYVWEAALDPEIRSHAEAALEESVAGIVKAHALDGDRQREYAASLIQRCQNKFLEDTVLRVGRDPLRKLAPEDRLVGAARLAESAQVPAVTLCSAIASALRFDPESDGSAVALRKRIKEEGIETVLMSVCGMKEGEPLFQRMIQAWEGDG